MKKSFRSQLIYFFITGILLVLIVTIITSTILLSMTFAEQRRDVLSQQTKLFAYDVSNNMNEKVIKLEQLNSNEKFWELLENSNKTQSDCEEIIDCILDVVTSHAGINEILIADSNGEIINKKNNNHIEDYSIIIKKAMSSGREEYFSVPNSYGFTKDRSRDYIAHVRRLRDPKNYETKYYILMNINKSTIFPSISNSKFNIFDDVMIFNLDGEIIINNTEEIQNEFYNNSEFYLNSKNSNIVKQTGHTYFFTPISYYTNWIVVTTLSQARMNLGFINIVLVLAGLGLILIIIAYYYSKIMTSRLVKPINKLNSTMVEFMNGNMEARVQKCGPTEVDELMDGFNHMACNLEKNVEELIKKQEEIKDAEVEAIKSKFELLQNQINPHFLYNTLNTISYLSMLHRDEDIRELVQSLNMLLRSVMNVDEEFVTLKREFEFLKSYINIQNYRFETPIDFKFDLPKEVENVKILKLIIQPIIENSIIHGIIPKGIENGHIFIRVYNMEKYVVVEIADNGVGMSKEKLEDLKDKLNQSGFNRVGLLNTNERIKMYYGEGVTIDATKGVGTIISFMLPKNGVEIEK